MPNVVDLVWGGTGAAALFIGAVLLYAASRAATEALAGKSERPGRRALGHWIPIAAAAIAAGQMNHPDLALAIIFATTVTVLSLVLGCALVIAPGTELPPALQRHWTVILPAAFLIFLTGFSGRFTPVFAEAFLTFGIIALFFWLRFQRLPEYQTPPTAAPQPTPHTRPLILRLLNFILALAIAIVGAIPAIHGVIKIAGDHPTALGLGPLTIVTILGPLLAAPMLADGPKLAHQKRPDIAMNACIGVALLNLCLLLPATIFLGAVKLNMAKSLHPAIQVLPNIPALAFPSGIWQIDNALLIVLGFALIPASFGRWRYGKPEGAILLAIYAAYIYLATTIYRPPLPT
jgi:Ca2+/Na+ antiporter